MTTKSKSKKKPSPAELLAEVKGQKPAKTYEFDDYLEVVDELKRKENSYADIATFLAQKLGISVTRGQVYRAHCMWLEVKEQVEREEAEARHYADMEEREPELPELEDPTEAALGKIASDIVGYLRDKYPRSSLPGETDYPDVLKRALAMQDLAARDEFMAEEEDKRLGLKKKEGNDAATNSKS